MQPTAEEMAIYRATARRREQQRRDRLHQRHQLGLSVAQQAAETLRQDFQAQRVVLFGSMRSPEKVHERSDVDLAVWGLHPRDYFRAVGQLLAIDPDMPIDVIEAESASPRMLAEIAATGVDL